MRRIAVAMERKNRLQYENALRRIREENNRMSLRRSRYYMLKLATDQANAMSRTLTDNEVNNVLNNAAFVSDYEMSDEE